MRTTRAGSLRWPYTRPVQPATGHGAPCRNVAWGTAICGARGYSAAPFLPCPGRFFLGSATAGSGNGAGEVAGPAAFSSPPSADGSAGVSAGGVSPSFPSPSTWAVRSLGAPKRIRRSRAGVVSFVSSSAVIRARVTPAAFSVACSAPVSRLTPLDSTIASISCTGTALRCGGLCAGRPR